MKTYLQPLSLIILLFIFSFNYVDAQSSRISPQYIADTLINDDGDTLIGINVPGIPPENFTGPPAEYTRSTVQLQCVPAFTWCFGCSATSAAMAAGYYDNNGYPNMYAGSTNHGVMTQTNEPWSDTTINGETRHRCPLSATGVGLDGRTARGHIEDYWILYGAAGPDPWDVNGWTEHSYGDCTADYMKTNQWVNPGEGFNTDGNTKFWYRTDGGPTRYANLVSWSVEDFDGGYGAQLFFESRGYTVNDFYNQLIEEEEPGGFTFDQYCDEIDAGRVVLIHIDGHTMLGYGYNDDGANEIIYIHDTWDWNDHQMDWAGSYDDRDHYGVSVYHLAPSTINVWEANTSNNWGTASNWSLGHIPTAGEHVVIPECPGVCIVDFSAKTCANLDIYPGAVVRIMDETLTVNGELNLYGEIEMNLGGAQLVVNGDFDIRGKVEINDVPATFTCYDYVFWQDGSVLEINDQSSDFQPQFNAHSGWRFLAGSNAPMEKGIVYFTGSSPSTAYVWTQTTNSYFHHIRMEKPGAYVYHSSGSTVDMVVEGNIYLDDGCILRSNSSLEIEVGGFLNVLSSTSHLQLSNGTLHFNGNPSVDLKPSPGDYVNNLRINTGSYYLELDDANYDTLEVNGYVWIESGYFDPNGFPVKVGGDWYNSQGPGHFIQAGSRVVFDGSGHQYIYDSEDFDVLESKCGAAIRLENASTTVNVANYDYNTGGWDVLAGTLNVNDLYDNSLYGVWYLNAGGEINVSNPGGWIDLNGELHIFGGTMTVSGGTDSFWAFSDDALIEMIAGTLDFVDQGIYLSNIHTLTESISGGRIRVEEGFDGSARTDFTPIAGMFEFYGTSDYYINQGTGNNFCYVEINKGSSTAARDSDADKRKTKKRNGGSAELFPDHPDIKSNSRANRIILSSDLVITEDLIISTGTLDVSTSNYSITVGGDWTNYVGDAGFNERQGTVNFTGANTADITTSETFYDLVMNKTYSSYQGLELNSYSTFNILDDLRIQDGCIEMNPFSILDINDSLVITADAGLNAYGDGGLEIWIGGNWYNYNSIYDLAAGFYPGTSTVYFDGSGEQKVYTNAVSEEFYDLVIDKPAGADFRPIDNITVLDDMEIVSGDWWDYNTGRNHYFYDDFTVDETNGSFFGSTQNTVRFMGTGDQYIDFPPGAGGYFYNVYINKIAPTDRSYPSGPNAETVKEIPPEGVTDGSRAMTVYLADDVIALNGGYLYVSEGALDLNNHFYRCTGNAYIFDNATLTIDENAWLEVGGDSDLRVYPGGTLEVLGTSGNEAKIEGHNDDEYDFYVYSGGTISAEYGIFEDMAVQGVYLLDGSILDASHSFDNCIFRYGSTVAGSSLLRIENSQNITIDGASFPDASPDADYNVSKTAYDHGSVIFTNCTGAFAGPTFENDTYDRINWDGQGNWLGTTSTNWNTASNWGFDYVPDLLTDVYIGPGCPNYPQVPGHVSIDYAGSFSYYCRSMEIDAGGSLTLTSGSIYNYGDLTVNGMLDIADDLNGYSGSVTNVYDTIYTGNQAGYVGRVNLNTGSVLNQYFGSDIFIETLYLHDGCYYNGSFGELHIYNSGTYPATNTLIIQDDDSHLPTVITEAGTNVAPSSCTYEPDMHYLKSYGDFSLNGYDVTTYYCDIYDDLNISGDTLTVTGNGPYFHTLSSLNMSSGALDCGGDEILFYSGATTNVTGGTILVKESFYDDYGMFSATGGTVEFYSSTSGLIQGSPGFYNMTVYKPGTILNSGIEGNGAEIHVQNNLNLHEGTLELNTASILDIDQVVTILSGAVLDANDSHPIEIYCGNDWYNFNTSTGGFLAGTGSTVIFDASSSASIQAVREKAEFNKVIINSSASYVRPGGVGSNKYIEADTIDIQSGKLRVSGDRIEVNDILYIAGTLEMDQPEDTLIAHNIIWQSGSNDNITDGKIFVNGDWTWENGTNAYISAGNTVSFNSSGLQFIYSYDADAAFYNLEIEKTGGSWIWIHTATTEDVHVLNNMNVHPGGGFMVQVDDLKVDGVLDVMSGGMMWMYASGDVVLANDFTLNGYLNLDGGGNVLVHGMFDLASTGDLIVDNGLVCCDAPYSAARGFCNLDGDFELTGTGVFEVLHNHISIGAGFNGTITGGTMRVGGSFISNIASKFQPSGGALEYVGSVSSGTYISMGDDNWLNNLVIDAGSYDWDVYSSSALHVKRDLTIESGSLTASTDTIYLGDDWTNNVGTSGFYEGTGKVILNGTSLVDIQQINGETFYDLENRNTSRHIEIAGNTTVSNNFYAGAGGSSCETFVTAPVFDVQGTLNLNQGTLALSGSAPTVTAGVLDQGGTLQLTDGSFTANDILEDAVLGTYVLNDGLIELNQEPTGYFDLGANIEIHDGTFNLIGGSDISYWPVGGSPLTFEMTGGNLIFEDLGIRLVNNDFSYDISGGSIRTYGDFVSNLGVTSFDPSGGNVYLLGNTNTDVSLASGSYFHDLFTKKGSSSAVTATSDLTIKNHLNVILGNFYTNGCLISVVP